MIRFEYSIVLGLRYYFDPTIIPRAIRRKGVKRPAHKVTCKKK